MKVMLDTNACIAIIKRRPSQVLKHERSHRKGGLMVFAHSYIRANGIFDGL